MNDFQGTLKEMILPPSAKPKPWEVIRSPKAAPPIKKARQRHKMIIALHLAGYTDTEIANQLGYTPGRVGVILSSRHPDLLKFRQEQGNVVADKLGDIILRFQTEAAKSVDTLVEIRDKADAPLSERRLSAVAILDRGGYGPVKKQLIGEVQVPISELREVVGEIAKANEVYERRSEWVVRNLPTGTEG